ncbi:SoxR reducing system RseC family protein [candidate division KSB1 bacterium]|nr:SoxR reducing system RseC family protein [candidate division KSB1 bacterium]
MIECGVIVSTKDGFATIQMQKGDNCKDCNICDSFGGGFRSIEAVNHIGAKIGDRVEVEIKSYNLLKYSFLVFIFPILMLIGGYFAGISLFNNGETNEGYGILGAFIGLLLSFILIKTIDKLVGGNKKTYAQIVHLSAGSELK